MASAAPSAVVDALRRDIHGYRVTSARLCDYCGGTFSVEEPVVYEVARYSDVENYATALGVPDEWFPDAACCTDCAQTVIDPETDGVAEAIVRVELTETRNLLRIDASELEVIEYSPDTDGYYPPAVSLSIVRAAEDLGLIRWHRLQDIFERDELPAEAIAKLRAVVDRSKEKPPCIE